MPLKPKYIILEKSNQVVKVPSGSWKYPQQGIITECGGCKKPIYITLYRLKKHKIHFCSKNCVKKRIKVSCQFCGKEFEVVLNKIVQNVGKFCDKSCAGKYQTKVGKLIQYCKVCGKEFKISKSVITKGSGKYCSRRCYYISMSGNKNVNWNGGYYQNYGYGFSEMVRLIKERDRVCQDCGKTDEEELKETNRKLSVHHIRPYNSFLTCLCGCDGKFRDFPNYDREVYFGMHTVGENRHPNHISNGVLLCNKCHIQRHIKIKQDKREMYKRLEEIL